MKKRVLIAPLDWGMGHTTRMIALAKCLEEQGAEVIFALPFQQQKLLIEYNFKCITIPGYNIKYYKNVSLLVSLMIQLPKIVFQLIQEKYRANILAKSLIVDIIVSDNRPFFRSKETLNAYVTHQINIQQKGIFGVLIQRVHRFVINKFDCCLIPDLESNYYAGDLSKNAILKRESLFLGPLSRFWKFKSAKHNNCKYSLAVVASGPLPWRNIFIDQIVEQLSEMKGNFIIIGALSEDKWVKSGNIIFTGHLPTNVFYAQLEKSKLICSLAGYTTIMDAATIKKPLLMMPTPGQGEQEYLSKHFMTVPGFYPIERIEEIKDYLTKSFVLPADYDTTILEQSCLSLLKLVKNI